MNNKPHPVGSYFDDIAADYAKRYDAARPYHHYLFCERQKIATYGIDFKRRSILDIGAGTGGLYDFIAARATDFDYFGTDVSPEMLAQSSIPEARRMVGNLSELTLPAQNFDYIFMLGVSTYLPPDELTETLQIAANLLAKNGLLVVSYTNPRGLDWAVRRLLRRVWRGRGVIGQHFETYAHDPDNIALPESIKLTRSTWYNATLTPFNTLLPRGSVWLASWIDRNVSGRWKPILCGDIVSSYRTK